MQLLQKDPLIESASFRLLPGSSPSQSILEVEVKEAKSFSASLSNNISGFSSFGTSQQQIVLREANVLGIGDSLSLGYIDTEITHDWNLSYTLPLNAHNGTLSFTYNQSETYGIPELNGSVPVEAQRPSEATSLERSTISSPFDSLHESGNLSNYGLALRSYELTLRQPVIRRIRGKNTEEGEQSTYEEFALGLTAYLGESSTTSSNVPSPFSSWPNDNGLTRTYALRFFQEWKRENAQDSIQLRSRFSVGLNAFGQIGLVSQDVILFNCSVRENIRMGYLDATDEQVEAAAKAAEIHKFILSLPQGYDTPVGDRGGKLSGGQRQRIALARALVRNPAILILDEATSALDPATEAEILTTIERITQDRTVIFITHRMAHAMRADVMYVLENGNLVVSG